MSAHMHPKAPFRVRPKSGGRLGLAPLLIRLPLCQSLLAPRREAFVFSTNFFFYIDDVCMALGTERSQTVATRARQRRRLPEGNIPARNLCLESACVRMRIGMGVPAPRPVRHRRERGCAWREDGCAAGVGERDECCGLDDYGACA